ncbi:alpha/beta-hydrolase family protein [Gordonia sp. (in: high G+C Gram-positive bacteria)]|uniref:alpha/beta-hydrolase family protein n=1 Tax=Gordonia sp. (in: high G+C Gram-positive bacteria) TaxID=84139 RepID=UPI003F9468B3
MNRRVHPAIILGGVIGWTVALSPGQLPRPAMLLAAVGTVLALVGMGIGWLVATFARDRRAGGEFLTGTAVVAGGLLIGALWWQTQTSAAIGTPPPGVGWAATVAGIPLIIACAVLWLPARWWTVGSLVAALLAAGPTAQARATPNVPDDPRLSYSLLSSKALDTRARTLVDEWALTDGPEQGAVVITVPTGSGWIDSTAIEGFVRHFDGSVRFLAVQYSDVPSWQAYVRSPESAGRSAIALLRALDGRLASAANPPRVYLYGQSLGAIGADTARAWAVRNDVDVAGTVLSGPPAGSVESLPDCARRISIANATDPVADFQTSLLWQAPRHASGTRTVGTKPSIRVPWTPVASFVGTALDLAVSLDGPIGSGHHYGDEQGLSVAEMPSGCQAIEPRAAS